MKVSSARAKLRKVTNSVHSSITEIKGGVMFSAENAFSVTFVKSGQTVSAKLEPQGYRLTVKAQLTDGLIGSISS
jgi:hypothetical protein